MKLHNVTFGCLINAGTEVRMAYSPLQNKLMTKRRKKTLPGPTELYNKNKIKHKTLTRNGSNNKQ